MTIWSLPKQTDFFAHSGGEMIVHSDESAGVIDLASPTIQKKLLTSFLQIRTIDKARTWIRKYGCPWGIQSFEYHSPQHVLDLAKSLSFLINFFELVQDQQVPLMRKYLRKQKKVDRLCSRMTEEEWNATIQRIEDGCDEKYDLMTWFMITHAAENPQEGFIVFSSLQEYGTELFCVEPSSGIDRCYPRQIHIAHLEIESDNLTETDCDERLLQLAYSFLQKSLQYFMGTLHPTVNVRGESIETYRLEQALVTNSPWQAMLSDLLRRMTSSRAPRTCENESCSKAFVPNRSDQIFCDRPGCRKAASRKRKQQSI